MPLFSSKPEKAFLFHIGSSSVAVGVVELTPGERPTVTYAAQEYLPYRDNVSPERLMSDMLSALRRANARLSRGGFSAKHVYYAFSSPWIVTQTKTASKEDKKPFTISKKLVDSILLAEEKKFETEMLGASGLADSLAVLERRVVQIKLSGEEIEKPYGKTAERADVSVFMSLIPKAVIDTVFDVSRSTLHPKDTESFSFSLASFSAIRDIFHDERDFVFVDVGGDLTDVSFVRDGLLAETASFPLGRHSAVREVSKALDVSSEEASSLMRLYHDGFADSGLSSKLRPAVSKASAAWSKAFHDTLVTVAGKQPSFKRIFAIVDMDIADFFVRAIKEKKVPVTIVNYDTLRAGVSFAKGTMRDPFIAALATFVGRVFESNGR